MKKERLRKWIVVLLWLGTLSVSAQASDSATADTLKLSVEDCVRIALSENPTIKVADMEITRMDYSKKETLGQLLPTLSFSGTYTRTLSKQMMYMDTGEGTMAMKVGRDNSHSVGFSASVPIIAPQLWKSLKLSDNQILQHIEAARSSRIEMVNEVQNAYYAMLLAYDSHEVLVKNHATTLLNLEIYKKKYANGTASEYDVLRSSVQAKNLEPSILEAENAIKQAKLQLRLLMGMDLGIDICPNVKLSQYEDGMYGKTLGIDTDLSDNTNLRTLDLQTDYLKKALDVQKMAWYPTLSATGSYTWNSTSNGSPFKNFQWNGYSNVGLTLSIPLYQGGQRYYKQKQAEISYKEMQWQRENLVRSLNVQVKMQMDNIQKNVKQISTNAAGVEEAVKANQIMEKSFQIGAASYLDLRDSEVALLNAQLSYNQAIYDYLVAESNLQMLLGKANVGTYPDNSTYSEVKNKK